MVGGLVGFGEMCSVWGGFCARAVVIVGLKIVLNRFPACSTTLVEERMRPRETRLHIPGRSAQGILPVRSAGTHRQ
jgi:hypothetical protein